jgi:hypothetical protein
MSVNALGNFDFPAVTGGDRFLVEGWVYGHASNVQVNTQYRMSLLCGFQDVTGANLPGQYVYTPTTDLRGVWTKVSQVITAPAGAATMKLMLRHESTLTAGDVYYWDDLSCHRVTEGAVADEKAVAAQAQANTATTNAATADGKAVVADGKAVTAQTAAATADGKAVVAQTNAATADGKAVAAQTTVDNVIQAGSGNIATNAGFEDTTQYLQDGTYVTSPVRSGTRAAKLVAGTPGTLKYIPLVANKTALVTVTSGPSRVYYIECWVYGDPATNTHTANAIRFYVSGYNNNGYVTAAFQDFTGIGTGQWVKLSAVITLPSNSAITKAVGYVTTYGPPAGHIYYFDDVIFRTHI